MGSPSFLTARKVVTHQATGTYKFGSWDDNTIASVWKRSQAVSSMGAPFSKLTISKLLVLKDKKAREDYFAQQAVFVSTEGRKDMQAEFATTIEVEGFRSKVLAVRPVQGVSSSSLFRLHVFWLFTLLGLSLPFRIWFGKHCDDLRVTVVKEVSTYGPPEKPPSSSSSKSWLRSWFAKGDDIQKRAQEFRKTMQSFQLYEEELSTLRQSGVSNTTIEDRSRIDDENSEDVPTDIEGQVNKTGALECEVDSGSLEGDRDNQNIDALDSQPIVSTQNEAQEDVSKTNGQGAGSELQ